MSTLGATAVYVGGEAEILRVERRYWKHAVLILDYEGSGAGVAAPDLEIDLDAALSRDWGTDAKAIVVEPEIDAWMWGAETRLREVVRWKFPEGIREWLAEMSFAFDPPGKPLRPKEALEAVFRRARLPRSAANYEELAKRVSLIRCQDPAFGRLRDTLRGWFPTA